MDAEKEKEKQRARKADGPKPVKGAAIAKPFIKGEGKRAQAPDVKLTPSAKAEQEKHEAAEKKRIADLKAEQEKEENKNLLGGFDNGTLIAKTAVTVSVKETILGVKLYQDGSTFNLVHDGVKGSGDSIAEAHREFKKAYNAAN